MSEEKILGFLMRHIEATLAQLRVDSKSNAFHCCPSDKREGAKHPRVMRAIVSVGRITNPFLPSELSGLIKLLCNATDFHSGIIIGCL